MRKRGNKITIIEKIIEKDRNDKSDRLYKTNV
jgi:hypothetical protein